MYNGENNRTCRSPFAFNFLVILRRANSFSLSPFACPNLSYSPNAYHLSTEPFLPDLASMDDEDWLDHAGTHQGSSGDPLVQQEYQRIATRYSDVGR